MPTDLLPSATDVRDRLAIVLDVDDAVEAITLAKNMRPWFGVAKVGLELFTAAGPDVLNPLMDLGYDVFLDLKLHDIPTTVARAARVAGSFGVRYLTIHASGGADMLKAGVDGLREGAAAAGCAPPVALAVTVLTSDADAPHHIVLHRVMLAIETHCGGLVCAASDLREFRHLAPAMITVVPGIRPGGVAANDQARTATPAEAIGAGADLLVIGRAVTHATDPLAAAESIAAEVVVALSAPPTSH